MPREAVLTPRLRARSGIIHGIPGLSWLFSKISHFRPKPPLEDLLSAPYDQHPTRPVIGHDLLHHIVSIEDHINHILSHLDDLESDDTSAVPKEPELVTRGMTMISKLYLTVLGATLDYQYNIWYPSPEIRAWETLITQPTQPDIHPELVVVAVRALEKAIYWRSIVLRQTRVDEPSKGLWSWPSCDIARSVDWGLVDMFLPPSSCRLVWESGNDREEADLIPGLDVLPYLLEKSQAALVHLLTRDRQVRQRPEHRKRPMTQRDVQDAVVEEEQEEDIVDLTPGEILHRAKYVTDLLGVFYLLPSKEARLALSDPIHSEDVDVDERTVGLWIRLKAGTRRAEILHDLGRLEKSELYPSADAEECDDEGHEAGGLRGTTRVGGSVEETLELILLQIERIPGEDLAPLLTRAQPWLPRSIENSRSYGSSESSAKEESDDSETNAVGADDAEDEPRVEDGVACRRMNHPDPPNRPLLVRLFRIYNRYQEYRYALHLSQPTKIVKGESTGPSSGKRKLSRFREDGELGAIWRRVMWGISEIIGMERMLDLGLDEDQAEEWQSGQAVSRAKMSSSLSPEGANRSSPRSTS